MYKEGSPFTPDTPVLPEKFVGREIEKKIIFDCCDKALSNRSIQSIFVLGERAIGKSSLCSFVRTVLEVKNRFLCIGAQLGGIDTIENLIRELLRSLVRETRSKENTYTKVKDFFGERLKSVDLFGIHFKLDINPDELPVSASDFKFALAEIKNKIGFEGLAIFLDDINGLAENATFANWYKSFNDGFALWDNRFPLVFIFAGLPERRFQLLKNQNSLDRVFTPIEVKELDPLSVRTFFAESFESKGAKISNKLLDLMVYHSGGLPVFMHEVGDAVWREDTDSNINEEDVSNGIISALQTVGIKYFGPQILDAIRSKKYRNIIARFSDLGKKNDSSLQFRKSELSDVLDPDEKRSLDNFLSRMKSLNVFKTGGDVPKGEYRFASSLLSGYFYLIAPFSM
ncbi:MAG: ATP-binding protein [Planctomycetes bacterium]|nr:ATP-binding protein [Planctomycetota bacterium]